MTHPQINKFIEKLQRVVENRELIKLTLAGKKDQSSDLKKVIITAVDLKRGYCLHVVYRHNTKDIAKNYGISEGINLITHALANDFLQAELFSNNENIGLSNFKIMYQ